MRGTENWVLKRRRPLPSPPSLSFRATNRLHLAPPQEEGARRAQGAARLGENWRVFVSTPQPGVPPPKEKEVPPADRNPPRSCAVPG